jgi:hypothetical protein
MTKNKLIGGPKTMREKAIMAENLYGGSKPTKDTAPPSGKPKIKPTGNPLKGSIGVKATWKF